MSFQLLSDPIFTQHISPNLFHPECPGRVVAIRKALQKLGVLGELKHAPLRQASPEELGLVHTPEYIGHLKESMTTSSSGYLDKQTYWDKDTWEVALTAVGSTVDMALEIWSDASPVERGFAVVRPPGHHARPGQAMGFCLFNTIAIAACALLEHGVKRVAILDVDFHHGNGTQEAFYTRGDVLYISTHEAKAFPGTGVEEERGSGQGENMNMNIVLPPQAGDGDILTVFQELIWPRVVQYAPEVLLVSAGFDSHTKDPLGNMTLTRPGFRELFRQLRLLADECCGGKIVGVLEGVPSEHDGRVLRRCCHGVGRGSLRVLIHCPCSQRVHPGPGCET